MSDYPVNNRFVNRIEELGFFSFLYSQEDHSPQVTFLLGASGVGKSALTTRVLDNMKRRIGIKVPMRRPVDSCHDDGYLIEELARSFHRYGSTSCDIPTLEEYNQTYSDILDFGGFGGLLLDDLAQGTLPSAKPLKRLRDRHNSQNQYSATSLLGESQSDRIGYLRNYLLHILEQHDVVLNIENIQAVDFASLEFLLDTLTRLRNVQALLEFTTDDRNAAHSLSELSDAMSRIGAPPVVKKLNSLPFEEYVSLFTSDPTILNSILRKAYIETDGNLRTLRDLHVQYVMDDWSLDSNPLNNAQVMPFTNTNILLRHISCCTPAQRFLLTLLAVHAEPVCIDWLHKMASWPLWELHQTEPELLLSTLKERELIHRDDGEVSIAHDLITRTVLEERELDKYRQLALRLLIDFYEELLEKDQEHILGRAEITSRLLSFCLSAGNEAKILAHLQDIHSIAIGSISPQRAIKFLAFLRNRLPSVLSDDACSIHSRVHFAILDTYYAVEAFDEAMALLDEMSDSGYRARAYRAALLDRLDRHSQAVRFCDEQLAECSAAPVSFELTLKLVKMMSLKSLNRYSECDEVFREMLATYSDLDSYEYGVLLRNSEMICPADVALEYNMRSVELFQRKNDLMEEGCSRIAYGEKLALLGRLSEADEEFKVADRILRDMSLHRYMVLNNRAAVAIYQGDSSSRPEKYLQHALQTITTSFPKLTIYNNLLVLLGIRDDSVGALAMGKIATEFLEASGQPDLRLHRTIYYNLAVVHRKRGDADSCGAYMDRARELPLRHSRYWRYRLWGDDSPETDRQFQSEHEFHLRYITFWHFRIDPAMDE